MLTACWWRLVKVNIFIGNFVFFLVFLFSSLKWTNTFHQSYIFIHLLLWWRVQGEIYHRTKNNVNVWKNDEFDFRSIQIFHMRKINGNISSLIFSMFHVCMHDCIYVFVCVCVYFFCSCSTFHKMLNPLVSIWRCARAFTQC